MYNQRKWQKQWHLKYTITGSINTLIVGNFVPQALAVKVQKNKNKNATEIYLFWVKALTALVVANFFGIGAGLNVSTGRCRFVFDGPPSSELAWMGRFWRNVNTDSVLMWWLTCFWACSADFCGAFGALRVRVTSHGPKVGCCSICDWVSAWWAAGVSSSLRNGSRWRWGRRTLALAADKNGSSSFSFSFSSISGWGASRRMPVWTESFPRWWCWM